MQDVVVVGAGHNGLIAACYLAQAGRHVLVVEALGEAGGGARTAERVPGFHFDLHSVAHNMINMTSIPEELDLGAVGLDYQEMDPISVAVHADGRRVRFFRSVDATVASIAEIDRGEAEAYRAFMADAEPLVRLMVAGVRGEAGARQLATGARDLGRVARQGPGPVLRDILGPYDSLLRRSSRATSPGVRWPRSRPTRRPGLRSRVGRCSRSGRRRTTCSASGTPGAAPARSAHRWFAGSRRWAAKFASASRWPASRPRPAAVVAVVTEEEERIPCRSVITAIDPKVALLELLDPPLAGGPGAELAATRRGDVVQALIHVATDRLPPYPGAQPGDWNGLQSFVDRLDDVTTAWAAAEAGRLPDPLPLYAFTTSALDDSLAPPGGHTVYLACRVAPAEVRGGWDRHRGHFVDAALSELERRAPGFSSSIVGVAPWTPADMTAAGRWPGAHPMHLDIALDQLGFLRPTPRLASHRTPVKGLYLSGAGSVPAGGVAGTPGRAAGRAMLRDEGRRVRRP